MSTTPVTRLYDAATIHEDSNESAAPRIPGGAG